MSKPANPLECKARLEAMLGRATVELGSLLSTQLARLQAEYEAIRSAHFPCVPPYTLDSKRAKEGASGLQHQGCTPYYAPI